MPDKILFLTGFMGSGKSTVAKILAAKLDCTLIDLDSEIVAASGSSIASIFAIDGEEAFRKLESSLLEKILHSGHGGIIATGGGTIISSQNRILMRKYGIIVNLKVTLEQVMTRLQGCTNRPLLLGDNALNRAKALMIEREQFYADADIRIDTDGKSVEDVAAEIIYSAKGFVH